MAGFEYTETRNHHMNFNDAVTWPLHHFKWGGTENSTCFLQISCAWRLHAVSCLYEGRLAFPPPEVEMQLN